MNLQQKRKKGDSAMSELRDDFAERLRGIDVMLQDAIQRYTALAIDYSYPFKRGTYVGRRDALNDVRRVLCQTFPEVITVDASQCYSDSSNVEHPVYMGIL